MGLASTPSIFVRVLMDPDDKKKTFISGRTMDFAVAGRRAPWWLLLCVPTVRPYEPSSAMAICIPPVIALSAEC
jgi:hypothetical protein